MMESQHQCGPVDLMRFEHLEIEKKRQIAVVNRSHGPSLG